MAKSYQKIFLASVLVLATLITVAETKPNSSGKPVRGSKPAGTKSKVDADFDDDWKNLDVDKKKIGNERLKRGKLQNDDDDYESEVEDSKESDTYKIGTDEDWEQYESEFRADELFTLIISKKRSITFSQKVDHAIENKTRIYMNFMAHNMEDKSMTVNYQIMDKDGKMLMDKKKLNHHVVKINPKKPTTYSFKLTNPNSQDVKVVIGIDCKECGEIKEEYMLKADFQEKLQALDLIQKDLGSYQLYLFRAKEMFYTQHEKAESIDWQLIVSAMVEMGIFIGITIWQIVLMKNLMVKRRII